MSGAERTSSVVPAVAGGGSFWKKRGLYLLGVVLVYVGVCWSFAIGYSSIPSIRWSIGLLLGPVIATPLAGLHLLLQWLLRASVRRFVALRPLREALVLNLPVTALMCVWVIGAYRGTAARPVFERFVTKPIPSSVRIVGHGGGQDNFAEGVRVGIWFEIEPSDLSNLIRTGGFVPTEDNEGTEYWKRQLRQNARLDVPLAASYALFLRESKPRTNAVQMSYIDGGQTSRYVAKSVSYDVGEYLVCPSNSASVFYLRLAR